MCKNDVFYMGTQIIQIYILCWLVCTLHSLENNMDQIVGWQPKDYPIIVK